MKTKISKIQLGTVVSIDDPTYSGRIKVRIKGFNDNIPIEQLPWATYAGSGVGSGAGGGAISIPKVGQKIRIKFKNEDTNSIEWVGPAKLDKDLSRELANDYAGSHVLLYDSDADLSIMFQPNESGLRIYYKGSFIQITPDNSITIHYGEDNSATQIQLTEDQVNITAGKDINITSQNNITLNAKDIILNGFDHVYSSGNTPGETTVNGKSLSTLLRTLAGIIDRKVPASFTASSAVSAAMGIQNTKTSFN